MDSNNNTDMGKEHEQLSLSSDMSLASTKSDSSSSLHSSFNSYDLSENSQENNPCIKEVYASDLKQN